MNTSALVLSLLFLAITFVHSSPINNSTVDSNNEPRHNTMHPACGSEAYLTTCRQTECHRRDWDCSKATNGEYPYEEQIMMNCNDMKPPGVARRCCKECKTMAGHRPTNNKPGTGSISQIIGK